MSPRNSPEIIDLTISTSAAASDDEIMEIENPQNTGNGVKAEGVRRKRKNNNKRSIEDVKITGTVSHSERERQAGKRNGVQSGSSRNRSRSPGPRRSPAPRPRSRSPQARDDFSNLFYVDVVPQPIFPSVENTPDDPTLHAEPKLLLPNHVSVIETDSIEISRPPSLEKDEEDFIEYLDYDDQIQGAVRYFDEIKEEKPATFVCKNCRAQGQHKTSECPVTICLTCDARNEHSTRSCPISKTCFRCGMKGHISQSCPNGRSSLADYGCDRCGGTSHKTHECPTWWRIYDYVSDEERLQTLCNRESKRNSEFVSGGEGFIGTDPACYQCGGIGHWGDDCNEISRVWDIPAESSAFSAHNVMSGPFYDPADESSGYQASYRDDLPENWGAGAPSHVGRQGRKKDRVKMEQRIREQQGDNDGDDWFMNPRNAKNRGTQPTPSSSRPSPGPKKMTFGLSIKDAARQFQSPSAAPSRPSLLDRMDGGQGRHDDRRRSSKDIHSKRDPSHERGRDGDKSSTKGKHGDGSKSRDRARHRDRHSGREWERPKAGSREDPYRRHASGPRYTGGYSR